MVMVSVDSIAIVGSMTRRIEEQLQALYGSRAVILYSARRIRMPPLTLRVRCPICFRTPLSSDEQAVIDRYAAHIESSIVKVSSKR